MMTRSPVSRRQVPAMAQAADWQNILSQVLEWVRYFQSEFWRFFNLVIELLSLVAGLKSA